MITGSVCSILGTSSLADVSPDIHVPANKNWYLSLGLWHPDGNWETFPQLIKKKQKLIQFKPYILYKDQNPSLISYFCINVCPPISQSAKISEFWILSCLKTRPWPRDCSSKLLIHFLLFFLFQFVLDLLFFPPFFFFKNRCASFCFLTSLYNVFKTQPTRSHYHSRRNRRHRYARRHRRFPRRDSTSTTTKKTNVGCVEHAHAVTIVAAGRWACESRTDLDSSQRDSPRRDRACGRTLAHWRVSLLIYL